MVARLALSSFALFVTAALFSCSGSDTLLLIDVRTDYQQVTEFDAIEIVVAERVVRHDAEALSDYTAGVRVAEIEGLTPGPTVVAARLLLGDTVVREVSRSTTVGDRTAVVIEILRDCLTGSCDPDGGMPDGSVDGASGDATMDGTTTMDGSASDATMDATGATTGWTMLDGGEYHTCGIRDDRAYCWGLNLDGQLGNGTNTASSYPTAVVGLPDAPVTSISAGGGHSCAVVTGAVYCWGKGGAGQLGDGTSRPSTRAVAVVGIPDGAAVGVSAGEGFTCARTASKLYCWGVDSTGQLGNDTGGSSDTAVEVVGPWGASARPSDVSAGADHACAVVDDQGYCWGHNDHDSALGAGSGFTVSQVPLSQGTRRLSRICIAGWHGCSLSGGAVFCWGWGQDGMLGDGRNTDSSTPLAVPDLASSVDALDCGGAATPLDATCAIRAGHVWCWGSNEHGRLGQDPAAASYSIPVEVPGITNATSLAVGFWHTCAILADETAWCWGRGDQGQLGNGTMADSTSPVPVMEAP